MDFLSDLINHRFVHKENKPRGAFMKIFFENKGIEKVNIGSLLHKVNDAIPKNFKLNSVPTVIFTRSSAIGSKMFNYKKTIEDLDTKTWDPKKHKCDCLQSKHCDPKHQHIVTGNLEIFTNKKLRSLLTKGPKFREANKIDWTKTYISIRKGIVECQKTWCNRENVKSSSFA